MDHKELQITDATSLGNTIRERRQTLGLKQPDLALAANVGTRFIVDVESGKETAQIGRVLRILAALGIHLTARSDPAHAPSLDADEELGIDDEPGGFRP